MTPALRVRGPVRMSEKDIQMFVIAIIQHEKTGASPKIEKVNYKRGHLKALEKKQNEKFLIPLLAHIYLNKS